MATLKDAARPAEPSLRFTKEAAPQNLYPLWEMVTGHQIHEPVPEAPYIWNWGEAERLISRAVEETNTETAERRVLLMGNPAYAPGKGRTATTRTLQAAYQILMPGESARPHRHNLNALRFFVEDGGETYTVVDGKECLMQQGDIVLTPSDCWHGHVHRGTKRSVWIDLLDSPLAGTLNAAFFEPASKLSDYPPTMPDNSYVFPGLSPVPINDVRTGHSPRFSYPWAESVRALAAAPQRGDGSAWIRLTNPAGGAMAMPPMELRLAQITRASTRPYRSTASTIVVVAQGQGVSTIGESEITWSQNDVFTVPQWVWSSHRAESDDAILFQVSDAGALEALGFLKEAYR